MLRGREFIENSPVLVFIRRLQKTKHGVVSLGLFERVLTERLVSNAYQKKQHAAQTEDVALVKSPRIEPRVYFWSIVGLGSEDVSMVCSTLRSSLPLGVHDFLVLDRAAKVAKLRPEILIQKDVLALQIAVEHIILMDVFESCMKPAYL